MSQNEIFRTGIFLDGGALIFAGGAFYHVRKGAVRFIRHRDQERMRNRFELAFRMARAGEASPVATVRPLIRPAKGGKAGVADFLRYARQQGAIA